MRAHVRVDKPWGLGTKPAWPPSPPSHAVSVSRWLFTPPSELGNDAEQFLQGVRFVFSDQGSERNHSGGQVQRELSASTLGSPKRWQPGPCCGKSCCLSDEDLRDGPSPVDPTRPQADDHAVRYRTSETASFLSEMHKWISNFHWPDLWKQRSKWCWRVTCSSPTLLLESGWLSAWHGPPVPEPRRVT